MFNQGWPIGILLPDRWATGDTGWNFRRVQNLGLVHWDYGGVLLIARICGYTRRVHANHENSSIPFY